MCPVCFVAHTFFLASNSTRMQISSAFLFTAVASILSTGTWAAPLGYGGGGSYSSGGSRGSKSTSGGRYSGARGNGNHLSNYRGGGNPSMYASTMGGGSPYGAMGGASPYGAMGGSPYGGSTKASSWGQSKESVVFQPMEEDVAQGMAVITPAVKSALADPLAPESEQVIQQFALQLKPSQRMELLNAFHLAQNDPTTVDNFKQIANQIASQCQQQQGKIPEEQGPQEIQAGKAALGGTKGNEPNGDNDDLEMKQEASDQDD